MLTPQDQLIYARKRCLECREEMAKTTTKLDWRRIEEDLNWWQGKVSYLETMLEDKPCRAAR